jgi:hypothetical protein
MLLSFGLGPGSHGGSVKEMEVFSQTRLRSFLNETLERPFSILNEVRWAILVRGRSGLLRKESIAADISEDEKAGDLETRDIKAEGVDQLLVEDI